MAEYRSAAEVEGVADKVMGEHHALLDQRTQRGIEWVMTKPSTPSGTLPDWKMRKITGIHAYLTLDEKPDEFGGFPHAESFIVVEVSERYWNRLSEEQRPGFCDHVLSHLRYDYEKQAWTIEGPEFGEFPEVLERHGFWRPDKRLQRFAETVSEQLSLLPEEPEHGEADNEGSGGENLSVSITHGGRTVETDTDTMGKLAEGDFAEGPNGERVDAETGEVLEASPAGARS